MTDEEMEAIQAGQANEFSEEEFDSIRKEESQENDANQEAKNGSGLHQLSDELGLKYEDIKNLLAMKHDTILSLDDPILMMVTIMNAYLSELEKLHSNHNKAVTKIMTSQTAGYISGVKETTDALSKTLADASVEAIHKIFDSHTKALHLTRINGWWCTAIITVSVLANVAMLALK